MKKYAASLLSFPALVAAAFLLIAPGCAKAPDDGKIPVTTSSEEAQKAFLEGRALADNLRLTDAIAHFDNAIKADPNFAMAHLARANVATTAKEFFDHLNHAVAHAGTASEGERLQILAAEAGSNASTVKQQEYLEKLIAAYPTDERAHFAIGGFYFGQQEYSRAIEYYKKSTELAPDFAPVYNILGYAYRQIENYPDAEKVFKKYTELIPNDPNPYDSYAELLMKMGNYDESITMYKKALEVDPNFLASRTGIAMNYLYKGMPAECSAECQMAYTMARNDGEKRGALFMTMVAAADAGNMGQALMELDKQYTLGEEINDGIAMAGDMGLKGNILCEMGRYDDALAAYQAEVKLTDEAQVSQDIKDNTRLFHHYDRVKVALGKGDMKMANAEAEAFREKAEASKNANQIRAGHELSGMIALAEKNYDGAIAELEKANQQNPYNLYRMALAYQAKGNNPKANEYAMKAADFNSIPNLNYAFVRAKAKSMSIAL